MDYNSFCLAKMASHNSTLVFTCCLFTIVKKEMKKFHAKKKGQTHPNIYKNILWKRRISCGGERMSVLQDLKGSNCHNHFLKIVSRLFTEVEGSMTFSCIKQSFVVVSFHIISDLCFLFTSCTKKCCNKPLKSSKLIQVVMHKLKALRRGILKLRLSKAIEIYKSANNMR